MTGLELGGLMVLVAGSFAATNVDNLILLVVLMGAEPGRRMSVVLGFLGAAGCVLAIATLGYATIPAPPLNAAIALSILFLGPEVVRARPLAEEVVGTLETLEPLPIPRDDASVRPVGERTARKASPSSSSLTSGPCHPRRCAVFSRSS